MRVLVTSGATREPIDHVRFITNLSTGRTGAQIADSLAGAGNEVLYLHADGALMPTAPMESRTFRTYEDVETCIREILLGFRPRVIIHAAAISDFQVESPTQGKLPSGLPVSLLLVPRRKILAQLRSWASAPLSVVAFKFTDTADSGVIRDKIRTLAESGSDWIVHNDLSKRDGDVARLFTVYSSQVEPLARLNSAQDLGLYIASHLNELTGEIP